MFSEKKFIIDVINQGVRCDGRSPLKSRVLEVQNNTELLAAGSSQLNIELCSAHLICGIKTEISDKPEISLSIELAGKSSMYSRERFKEISTILEKLLLQHIDKAQLEILPGKKYWKLFIDVLVIDENASNLVEQIGLSVILALKNSKIIGVEGYVNKNTQEEFLEIKGDYWSLDIAGVPAMVSVSLAGENLVLDLTSAEEECVDTTLHIAVDSQGNIKGIVKEGAGSLPFYQITQAISAAKSASIQIFTAIHNDTIRYQI